MRTTLSYFLLLTISFVNVRCSSKSEENCDSRQVSSNTTAVCDFKEHDHRLVCFHGLEDKWKFRGENVRTLLLCDWPQQTFDPQGDLRGFYSLKKLVIAGGNLTKLTSAFPREIGLLEVRKLTSETQKASIPTATDDQYFVQQTLATTMLIRKLNITGTKLRQLPDNVFNDLSHLKTLDFRNNSIAEINVATFNIPSLQHIHLSGNPLKCTEDTKWILDEEKGSLGRKISDKSSLRCAAPYEGRPLVPVTEIIKTLKEECRRTVCECELVYVVGHGGKHIQRQLMAFASVNCSHRELTEMPSFLPANTTTLRLSGNKIKDLRPLTTNPAYRGVIDLYIDDNLIESIVQLEGSSWVDRFRLLSLRGNKLTDLPTYALQNVLQHNGNAVSLYLGNNPWRCDCLFTPGFQDLLIKYTTLMKDINDVKCARINGDDNSGKIIRDLKRTEICVSPDEEYLLHPLDVLNIILALLIFLIIVKVLYDYWSFRKTGKLPWIVAKIP